MSFKVGFGYDVHRLIEGRPCILGGVEIPYEKGLDGHSDADVLLHAVCDAILGALGQGDIGEHFPNTDPAFKGVSSLDLLAQVMQIVVVQEYTVGNVDIMLICEAPKIEPYKARMQEVIADKLNISVSSVNIKATTNEGLGFVGRGEGIAAQAVVLLESKN